MKLDRERTQMANERTILAYIRTSLNILVFGIAVNKFYSGALSAGIFTVAVILGILVIFYGVIRFIASVKKLRT